MTLKTPSSLKFEEWKSFTFSTFDCYIYFKVMLFNIFSETVYILYSCDPQSDHWPARIYFIFHTFSTFSRDFFRGQMLIRERNLIPLQFGVHFNKIQWTCNTFHLLVSDDIDIGVDERDIIAGNVFRCICWFFVKGYNFTNNNHMYRHFTSSPSDKEILYIWIICPSDGWLDVFNDHLGNALQEWPEIRHG